MSVFDNNSEKYDGWYDRNKFAYLSELNALKKVIPGHSRGIEIGVGTGRFAAPLGIDIGLDPSARMIEIARNRGVSARRGVGEDLPFFGSIFDYVAIIITLCFVKDVPKVLKEAERVLKPNGKIILGLVDKKSFLGKLYRKKRSPFYKEAKFFGIEEATKLLSGAGFRKFSYYQTLFNLPSEIKSVQKTLKGFGRGGFVVIAAAKGR
jgi:ubiquinone/menaquinone biosynthesis C-methylase UbiE